MKSLKITLAALAFAMLSGCNQDVEGPLYTKQGGFAFAAAVLNVETGTEDDGKISVPVYRSGNTDNIAQIEFEIQVEKTEGDSLVLQWVSTDPDGIFSLTTPRVVFADGATVAYAQIRYTDIEELGITDKYKMRLTIKQGLSPSGRGQTTVTVNRRLTFDYLGKCEYADNCLFDDTYTADIYLAREAEIYRIMDPYSEGLLKEEYAENNCAGTPSAYVQLICDQNGAITYEPFCTGMLYNAKYPTYAYWPGEYVWGADFSKYNSENRKISDKHLQLYPVYCVPTFQYGYLGDGAYKVDILLP